MREEDGFAGQYKTIIITLNNKVSVKVLPKYYLEYEEEHDRCLLLFKGINGDLDHWVLGDSFLKTLYLVFDADNYKLGVMTNPKSFGWDHEDLMSIYKPQEILSTFAFFTIVLTFTILIIVLLLFCKLWIKRRRRIAL